jgi:hypothetical protein
MDIASRLSLICSHVNQRASEGLTRAGKTAGLVGVVVTAALLPLYGDPRPTAVSHAEWARLLLRGLDLLDPATRVGDQASIAFTTLSGRDSLSLRSDRYIQGRGVEPVGDAADRRVRANASVGEVSYALAVARSGEYRLRLRLGGDPATPAEAEVAAVGAGPKRTFSVVPGAIPGWVDVGAVRLTPGAYTASVLLPRGTELQWIELAPPCVNAIEPRGGWKAAAVARTDDVALTVLRALDQENELPPAAPPIELLGSDFQLDEPSSVAIPVGLNDKALRAGPRGAKAVVMAELPEPGLYTLSFFGTKGGGQSWGADQCRRAVLCPDVESVPAWHTVLSGEFSSGLHTFTVVLGAGAAVERLRLERKKDSPADYVATLRRMGLELGPDGPVARARADEAWQFVRGHRASGVEQSCGEVVLSDTRVASAGPAAGPPPGGGVTPPGVPPVNPPIGPPVLPPVPPASPTLPE